MSVYSSQSEMGSIIMTSSLLGCEDCTNSPPPPPQKNKLVQGFILSSQVLGVAGIHCYAVMKLQ